MPEKAEAIELSPKTIAEYLKSIGLSDLAPIVEETLLKLYLAHPYPIPTKRGCQGSWLAGPVQFTKLADIDSRVESVLKGLDLAYESRQGRWYSGVVFGLRLTDRGVRFGGEVLRLRLRERGAALRELVKRMDPRLVFAACIAFGPYIEVEPRYKKLLEPGESPLLKSLEDELLNFELRWVIEDYRWTFYQRHHISNPLALYERYLANLPDIRRKILSYYEKLLDVGLAIEIPIYSVRKADYVGDAISTSPEVVEYIWGRVAAEGLPRDEDVKQLNKLALLWELGKRGYDYRVGSDSFLELLTIHGIRVDELREELEELNKAGITSKYLDKPGERPFIVVDEKRFAEHLAEAVKSFENKLLHPKS